MKQILFLLLFPCLALAQYQGNAGQKITLGEQTTADGLVYRGVANDTNVITPFSDTSAYIILDTVDSKFYHYNRTTTYWALAGGGVSVSSFGAGTTGLTPSTATTGAVTLGGTLSGANGGTGLTTFGATGNIPFASSTTSLKTNNLLYVTENASFKPILRVDGAIRLLNAGQFQFYNANSVYNFSFSVASNSRIWILQNNDGSDVFIARGPERRLGIRYNFVDSAQVTEALSVNGNARITGLANASNPVNVQVDVNGVLVRTSSIDIKEDVQSLPYGLNEVMLLQPSKFSYIDKYKYGEGYDIGFIAQDVNDVIPEAVGTGIDSDIFMDSVKLIPVLTKAIQEQNALIKALEQRILILENK